MSKYTEAIERLKHKDEISDCKYENCDWECEKCADAMDTAIEALQIAERLEQAITDEQTADYIIVDVECVNNKHDKEVWLNGYNQALTDIRGNAE